MQFNGINFDAIVATPGCGKSYLCDRFPELFVDVDEVRLRCKYIVPENITREELEKTKGERTFERRAGFDEYVKDLHGKLEKQVRAGKILITSPHAEEIDFLKNNNIKFCFVFPNREMKQTIEKRMKDRGNPPGMIKKNIDMFDEFYKMNIAESDSCVHYELGPDEYLFDAVKKFGIDLENK